MSRENVEIVRLASETCEAVVARAASRLAYGWYLVPGIARARRLG
jgi:hypothetical protein